MKGNSHVGLLIADCYKLVASHKMQKHRLRGSAFTSLICILIYVKQAVFMAGEGFFRIVSSVYNKGNGRLY